MSKANVAIAMVGQGELLMTVPVAGRLPQFIAIRNTLELDCQVLRWTFEAGESSPEKGERSGCLGVGAQPFSPLR